MMMHGNRRAWGIKGRQPVAAVVIAIIFCAAGASTARSQSTIVIPGAGEVTTVTRVDNGILAVSNQVIRNRSRVRECIGVRFYAAKTTTRTWICRHSDCILDCSGREPVGSC